MAQHAAPAYRIYQGETILGVVWSNAVVNMTSSWRVVYDDGDTETLILDRFTTGSARAAQLISTAQVARKDGYVTVGQTFADGAQRGQTYVVMYISQGYNPGDVRAPIAKGYVYASVPLALGQQVEPGPAGGHGYRTPRTTTNPAAGAEVLQAVPTGAMWRLITCSVQLVQGLTQTPLPSLRIRDSLGFVIAQIPIMTTALAASTTAQLTWGQGLVQTSFVAVVADEQYTAPIPMLNDLLAGYDFGTITDGIGANTDYGAMAYLVEEWVMPT